MNIDAVRGFSRGRCISVINTSRRRKEASSQKKKKKKMKSDRKISEIALEKYKQRALAYRELCSKKKFSSKRLIEGRSVVSFVSLSVNKRMRVPLIETGNVEPRYERWYGYVQCQARCWRSAVFAWYLIGEELMLSGEPLPDVASNVINWQTAKQFNAIRA